MKRIFCMLLCVCFLPLFTFAAAHAEENIFIRLSEMTEDECIAFVKEKGVIIPAGYNEQEWGSFIKNAIQIFETNPYAVSQYSHFSTA